MTPRRAFAIPIALVALALSLGGGWLAVEWGTPKAEKETRVVALARGVRNVAPALRNSAGIHRTQVSVRDSLGRPVPESTACRVDTIEAVEGSVATLCETADRAGIVTLNSGSQPWIFSAPGYLSTRLKPHGDSETVVLSTSGSALQGLVSDLDGGPVSGALAITLTTADIVSALGRTNEMGVFEINTAEFPALLRVTAEGYSTWQASIPGPTRNLSVKLSVESAVAGRVLLDDAVTGVANALVEVTGIALPFYSYGVARSDASGYFRIGGLNAGHHELSVRHDEIAFPAQSVELAIAHETQVAISAAGGGKIMGQIRVGGTDCAGGQIGVVGATIANLRTDSHGVYQSPALLPGDYEVRARCTDAVESVRQVRVAVGAKHVEDWDLSAAMTLSGSVTGRAQQNLSGITIRVVDDETAVATDCAADEHGKFRCTGLRPSLYHCSAVNGASEISNTVAADLRSQQQPNVIHLSLFPTADLRVRLLSLSGVPLSGFTLLARRVGAPTLFGEERGDGWLEFRNALPGDYELRLNDDPLSTTVLKTRVVEGMENSSEWRVGTESLTGRVLDEGGMPLPDIWVAIQPSETHLSVSTEHRARTASDGSFSLMGLVPGRYRVQAIGPTGATEQDSVETGDEVTLTLRTATSSHLPAEQEGDDIAQLSPKHLSGTASEDPQ